MGRRVPTLRAPLTFRWCHGVSQHVLHMRRMAKSTTAWLAIFALPTPLSAPIGGIGRAISWDPFSCVAAVASAASASAVAVASHSSRKQISWLSSEAALSRQF